jgi:hypothetical protein
VLGSGVIRSRRFCFARSPVFVATSRVHLASVRSMSLVSGLIRSMIFFSCCDFCFVFKRQQAYLFSLRGLRSHSICDSRPCLCSIHEFGLRFVVLQIVFVSGFVSVLFLSRWFKGSCFICSHCTSLVISSSRLKDIR